MPAALLDTAASSSTKPAEVDIKIEYPNYHLLKQEAQAVKSGESEAAKQMRSMKLMIPQLLLLATTEGASHSSFYWFGLLLYLWCAKLVQLLLVLSCCM